MDPSDTFRQLRFKALNTRAEVLALSPQLIFDTLTHMRPSSPALDQIAIDELQVAASFCPQLTEAVATFPMY